MPFPEGGDEEKVSESAVYDHQPTFSPYDPPTTPEAVQPSPPGPAPSSSAPGIGDTSGADSEQEPGQPEDPPQEKSEEQDPLPEFDPKHRDAFTGMLYLGRLQESFTLWGHHFVVRTVTTEQLAEIGRIVRPYEGTFAREAVYQSAVVAACVVSVDGQPLPGPITVDDSDELASVRFPYVMRNWMPPVREAVYDKCFALEMTSREVLAAMGEASG